jgi:4-hydroxy-tetrahydrodipicolinate synthase
MARFGQVLTAMATPFDEEGRVDLDGVAQLARWLVDHGNDGLVVTGTTGEAATLTDDEQVDVWRAARSGAPDASLVAGAGVNDTRHSVALASRAAGAGMDGVLLVTPYYNRPSQAGIEQHFRTVCAATDLPVLLYDIPVRTGRKISHEVLVRLADEVDNVVGVKDAAGNPAESARLVAETPDTFELYAGDDSFLLPLLAVGAVGVIGVATHWVGGAVKAIFEAVERGDWATARAINAELIPSYDYESFDAAPNPVPAKAILRVLGLPGGLTRPPMGPEPAGLEDQAAALLAALGDLAPQRTPA